MATREVSVDFGSSSLRAVEFSKNRKGDITVRGTAEVPLTVGTIHGGIIENVSDVSMALKSLWTAGKFKSKQVRFAVANRYVVARRTDLDWIEPKMFREALPYRIPQDILPHDAEYLLDYHVMDEFVGKNADGVNRRRSRILVAAAEADMIGRFVNAIEGAGLKPARADLTAFTLTRLAAARTTTGGGVELVVDIGAHTMNLVIHQAGQPLFVRNIPNRGSDNITNDMVNRFSWTREEAEGTKKALGISRAVPIVTSKMVSPFAGTTPNDDDDSHPAQKVVDHFVADFISEIRTSVDWFLNASHITSVDTVMFSGGAALADGLADRIASELQIPVHISDPFVDLDLSVDDPNVGGPQWATAVGLTTGRVF